MGDIKSPYLGKVVATATAALTSLILVSADASVFTYNHPFVLRIVRSYRDVVVLLIIIIRLYYKFSYRDVVVLLFFSG